MERILITSKIFIVKVLNQPKDIIHSLGVIDLNMMKIKYTLLIIIHTRILISILHLEE